MSATKAIRRIAVVVTSRASYARIKTALQAIERHPDLELRLIVGGSALLEKYGSAASIMEHDGFTVSERVYMVLEGENAVTMAKTTGLAIMELATVIDNLRPDAVITVADRFETIATAVAATYQNIPLVHVQGGEITGSIDEKVRHAVTKLADLHFVSNSASAERIRRMGECPDRVFVTGCPSIDLAAQVVNSGHTVDVFRSYGGVGPEIDLGGKFLVVMQHPVTSEAAEALSQVRETLMAIHDLGLPTLWFWPNIDAGADLVSKGIRMYREQFNPAFVHFFKNMAAEDFLAVLHRAACVVGNSSVAIREASFLGVPAVNIGNRQRGRETGTNVLHVAHARERITEAIRQQLAHGPYPSAAIYGDGHAGERIADLLSRVELPTEKRLAY